MQTLITPTVVVTRAFADGFERLLAGDHADFADEYLAAPLALYVRYLITPQLDLRHGQGGTVQPRSDGFAAASDATLRRSRRALLKTARRLLRRASDYLESHAAQFPQANVLNRCSIDGKLVQTR